MGFSHFLGTLLLSATAWGADVYHHDLSRYPKNESCGVVAADLAQRFSAATGAEIYWAGARQESATTCDIRLSYIADKELEIIGTVDRSGLGASRKGTKDSYQQCALDLQREVAIFKKSTGLVPWISYCYQEDDFLNSRPFVPVVEGKGEASEKFFASDNIFRLTPSIGWNNLLGSMWKAASDNAISVASIVERPYLSASSKEVTIRYYAKERLYLRMDGIAEHNNPAICDVQVEEIGAALAKAKTPPLAVYCGQYSYGKYRLGIVTLSTNILGIADFNLIEDPKQFLNLEACRAELPSTLEFYRQKLGKKILAGMCADDTGRFHITAIHEKTTPVVPRH